MRDLVFDIKGRDKTQAAFDAARRNARAFNADLDRTGMGMRLAATAAKAFAAAFTVTAVANFGRAVREAVGEASSLVKMADKVGVASDDLQRMVFGFGQAGVAASDMERNLEQWSKRISEAVHYGGRLGDIFKANNVSLTDSNGKMRSNLDILRDFADLMKNAATDQERMTLATEAFGRSGGDMILALRGGAAAMDELMSRTEAAGGVIDEQLLRKAEEIDDEFDRISRTIEINVKTALLNVAGVMFDIHRQTNEIGDALGRLGNASIFEKMARFFGADTSQAMRVVPGQGLVPGADRRGDRLGRRTMDDAQRDFDDAFAAWAGGRGQRTVIPCTGDNDNDGRSRRRSASAAREQASAFDEVIARLREEQEALGLNSTEQRVLAEQRRAGVSATSEQGRAIEALVTQIEAESNRLDELRERQDAINEGMTYLGDLGAQALEAWANGAGDAEQALKRLVIQLGLAAAQALLLGQGPLSGFFGFLGGRSDLWAGSRIPGFAGGTSYAPGGLAWVGEQGPELINLPQGSRVYSAAQSRLIAKQDQGGGGAVSVHVGVSVDDDGKLKAYVQSVSAATTEAGIKEYDKGSVARTSDNLATARRYGMLR